MTRFLPKAFLFILVVFVCLFCLQLAIDSGLRKSRFRDFKEWNEILDSKIKSDLIIQGSSRAYVHFSPKLLDSLLSLNTYNLGIDGYGFIMQYYRLQIFLEHNTKPRYLIQSLDLNMMRSDGELYNHEQFLPYLNLPLIRTGTSQYTGSFDFMDYNVPLYKYHNCLRSVYVGLSGFVFGKKYSTNSYKGFRTRNNKWDNSFEKFKSTHPQGTRAVINSKVLRMFEDFLGYCKSNGITVVLVYSPEYIEAQKLFLNRDSILHIYSEYAEKYNFPLLDYSQDSICYSVNNFYNSQHLNATGVLKFNKRLAKDLIEKNIVIPGN